MQRAIPMKFSKYHALGNDYLILDPKDAERELTKAEIRRICHRNFGLGADGILYGPLTSDEADFGLRILNPDGGEAEKSGNGLRIFSRYLWDLKRIAHEPFTVSTSGGIVTCQIGPEARKIVVKMGRVSFDSEMIPVAGPKREVLGEFLEVNGRNYQFYAATIGNPHCVLPLEEISSQLARELGPILEKHPLFPNRTNVQLLKVLDRSNIQLEIWERGAGYTLASGSSSCAAAAVARKMNAVESSLTVHMPGGKLDIQIGENYAITMSGPVTRVGVIDFDQEALGELS